MNVNEIFHLGIHEGKVFESFEEHEIEDGGQSESSVEGCFQCARLLELEGEEDACEILHHHSGEEGDWYAHEDTDDDLQRF